jgi:hypothetical protein
MAGNTGLRRGPLSTDREGDVRRRSVTGVTRPCAAYDCRVKGWLLAALGVAIAGAIVAFLVVPYGPRDCPGLVYCDPWGARPRVLTLPITAVVVLGLLAAAIVHSAKDR